MSATVIPFPLAARLIAVAASGSSPARQPLGGIRNALRHCVQACADAAHGDEVDIEVIAAFDRAVRSPAWDDIDARVVARQVWVALGWLSVAQREALVASAVDGEDAALTAWAADRALKLGNALSHLQCALEFVGCHRQPRPPWLGPLDLNWPSD